MEQSYFIKWVKKNFPRIVIRVVGNLNDSQNALTYRFRSALRPEYSVSGLWESVSVFNTAVMADVVAMDSSLPLKKRDAVTKAHGKIPKMGMELQLNEQQLTDLDTLIAQGATESQILAKLFADTPKVIKGVYERIEAIYLEGLSSGVALVEDDETVGTGVRVDYGYEDSHKFGVAKLWSDNTAKPFDDIQKVLDQASTDGNTPTIVKMDKATFNNLAATDQAKELYAFKIGFVGSNVPIPDLVQVNSYTSDRYGFTIEIIERAVRYERNGKQTVVKPWKAGSVIFQTSEQVGNLVYARLAEMNHPVSGVEYQTVENYILVSKYRQNKPSLAEITSSQARVVPVIANVDQIYMLDSKTVQA